MKKNPVLYKSLVLGVIVLFIGIGVQPVIALTENEQNIKAEYNENVTYLSKGIIVDQAVETICGNSEGRHTIKSHMPFGQSFKPLYKLHYGIELHIADMNPSYPLVPIQISLRKDTINGSYVPGTDITLDLTSGQGWRYFEFISPVDLEINQTYVIDISTTNPRWGVQNTEGHCYDRGLCYIEGEPAPLGDLYFRTYVLDNSPPSAPLIDGPIKCKPARYYNYTFVSTDPNGDNIQYYIEWGDGSFENWFGPFESGLNVTRIHSWPSDYKTYRIRAKAEDTYGAESDWGYLEIEIPRNKASSFHWFLERFPLLERLLSLLL